MKKTRFLPILGALFTLMSVQAYSAEYWGGYQNGACCEPTCCEQECCSGTFGAGADWIYWRTDQTNLTTDVEVEVESPNEVNIKALSPKFQYHNGWRVFADYTTCDRLWTFAAIYTHLPSSAKRSANEGPLVNSDFARLFEASPIAAAFLEDSIFSSLDANWNSSFNYLDLVAFRAFNVCETIQIVPYIGARGLWTEQKFRLAAEFDVEAIIPAFASKLKAETAGVGLLGGVKGNWQIFNGFSLVANVGGAVLYSWHRNHADLDIFADDAVLLSVSFKRDKLNHGIPMFDAFIGLVYENTWNNFGFNIHAGWEEHIVFDTHDFLLNATGNTTFQGLTLGAGVRF